MFILLASILILMALLFVFLPLFSKRTITNVDRQSENLQATRQQIKDIEKDLENDLIATDQLDLIREEAENTLLLEMQESDKPVGRQRSKRFNILTAIVLTVFIPVTALLVYLSVGSPSALIEESQQFASENGQPSLEQLVEKLEQRLAQQPNDEQGWLVLAQTNMMMQRYDHAVKAMEKLYQLNSESADVLARYADSLTMANNGRFDDQAKSLISSALDIDPNHVHALWLAGVNAYQDERYESAIQTLEKARSNMTDSENLAQVEEIISAAKQRLNESSSGTELGDDTITMAVSVNVDASLADEFNLEDSVFVFAKAANGPPMPLAVSKHKASELPLTVTLSDAMAMIPELTLSSFDQVVISARISAFDQPIAQAGDLQGESSIINPSQVSEIEITINQVVE